jgi:hypothetical protein
MIVRALASGLISGTAAALAASWAGRRQAGSYAAPLNATSHIAWGDEAARHDRPSLKYTGTGAALHYGAALFWAALYESLPGPAPLRAAATTGIAYVADYHLVPRRLTPGFELRLSKGALAAIYVALALGLCAGDLARRKR